MTKKELKIPYSTFENEVSNNSYSLLRVFVSVVGIDNAREIINLLTSDKPNLVETSKKIFSTLRENFKIFENLNDQEIEKELVALYDKANEIIIKLIDISFTGMENELGLLNTTTVPLTNLAKRLTLLISDDKVTERYKFEMVRQDLLALMLLELNEHNHLIDHIHRIHDLNEIFEESIYEGKIGLINDQQIFSVHDNLDNNCTATFNSLQEAREYILDQNSPYQLHIKKHDWKVRNVANIGPVLTNMRTKSNFSLIRKAIAKANNQQIEINHYRNLTDSMGFMFVTPVGVNKDMFENTIKQILIKYPFVDIEYRSYVGEGRGQSSSVSFLRAILRFPITTRSIEIMVLDQKEYLNYRYQIEQAHRLFAIEKSKKAARLLFPEEIYHQSSSLINDIRDENLWKITNELLAEKRFSFNQLS